MAPEGSGRRAAGRLGTDPPRVRHRSGLCELAAACAMTGTRWWARQRVPSATTR